MKLTLGLMNSQAFVSAWDRFSGAPMRAFKDGIQHKVRKMHNAIHDELKTLSETQEQILKEVCALDEKGMRIPHPSGGFKIKDDKKEEYANKMKEIINTAWTPPFELDFAKCEEAFSSPADIAMLEDLFYGLPD